MVSYLNNSYGFDFIPIGWEYILNRNSNLLSVQNLIIMSESIIECINHDAQTFTVNNKSEIMTESIMHYNV